MHTLRDLICPLIPFAQVPFPPTPLLLTVRLFTDLHVLLSSFPDQYVMLKYCPALLSEMLNALTQVWAFGMSRKGVCH